MRLTDLCGIATAITFAALPHSAVASTRIEVIVKTHNDDQRGSEQARRMAVIPPTTQELPPGTMLPELVRQNYRVDATERPLTYAELTRQIVTLNALENLVAPMPRTLVLPTVPPESFPKLAQLTAPRSTALRILQAGSLVAEAPQAESTTVRESNETVMSFSVPDESAADLLTQFRQNGLDARVVAGPISLRMAGTLPLQNAIPAPPLVQDDVDAIASLIAHPAVSTVPVYILDTGWPTAEDFTASRAALATLLDAVRIGWRLGPSAIAGYSSTFEEPTLREKAHCRQIADAIKDLTKYGSNHVKPIYLPLSQEQHGDEILHEFLRLSVIARRMADGNVLGTNDPTPDVLETARTTADQDLSSIPAKIDSLDIRTDRAAIEAIISILDLFARTGPAAPHRYVLNLSWTVSGEFTEPRLPASPLGVFVAAAGNVKNQDIYANNVDFARRSLQHRDTLAVLNIDSDGGPLCDSSTFDIALADDAMLVGFDGRVTANVCGTSFAAPRVAWILALREAWTPSLHPERWATDLFNRLKRQRGGAAGFASVWFRPSLYIKDPR